METKDWFTMTEEEKMTLALSALKTVENANKREARATSRRRKAKADFCNMFNCECGFIAM